MKAKLRSLRKKIKRPRLVVGIVAACVPIIALIIAIIGGYLFNWTWAGVSQKTLWDWLNLLGVLAIPVVVGFGVAWFTTQQGKVSDAENKDNQRETALQTYIDKMSELLLHENLRGSAEDAEVRQIARVLTLTLLPRLDGKRKGSVLQFLQESNLIDKENPIVDLYGADLSHVELELPKQSSGPLRRTNLSHINLHGADLSQAYLQWANLSHADLRGANLQEASLWAADLSHTDLSYANLHGADLFATHLEGANLITTTLSKADLRGSVFGGTILDGYADMRGVDLREVDLKGITGISFEELEEKGALLQGATKTDGSKYS